MNAFLAVAAALLAGCASAATEQGYQQAVADTNVHLERAAVVEAETDRKLVEALTLAAREQPALVASVAATVLMARALRAPTPFQAIQAPRHEVCQWLSGLTSQGNDTK